MGKVVADDIGTEEWSGIEQAVRASRSIDVPDINKNTLFIGYRLAEAWDRGKKSASLEKLCKAIIDFAAAVRRPPETACA
jgi:hypothetical protein